MNSRILASRTAALGVAVLIAVAGCSGGSSAAQKPQETATATATATAPTKPTPPALSTQARQPTQAGAEAFLQYWWDVYTYSYQSGDTELLASISDLESCSTCNSTITDVQSMKAKNEITLGGAVTVQQPTLISESDYPAFKFTFEFTNAASTIVDPQGKELRAHPAAKGPGADTLISWEGGHWVVTYIAEKGLGR